MHPKKCNEKLVSTEWIGLLLRWSEGEFSVIVVVL
jgi:hypothetical protein